MRKLIKLVLMIGIISASIVMLPIAVKADNPFITSTVNRFGEIVETQDAYESIEKIKNIEFGTDVYQLNAPNDIYLDADDYCYIADTGNKRIIILDQDLQFVTSFGEEQLYQPYGIFVRENVIYVADYGLPDDKTTGQVVLYNFDKVTKLVTLKEVRGTPDSKVLEIDNFVYRPKKIAVDTNLTMYVVCEGSYNGILTINDENRFMSYFAPNNVSTDLKTKLIQFFYGENQKANVKDVLPTPPFNVHVDDSGYIYTVTQTIIKNDIGDTLKKVNIGGENFYPAAMTAAGDFVAAWSGKYGNVFAATKQGFIYEYDLEGNVLFIFGGWSQTIDQLGLFKNIMSIAVNSHDNLYVLDQNDNSIQIFRPTDFTNTVHTALGLYNEGKYTESKELWEKVLVYNSMSDLAHKGIGLAHFMNGDYEEALKEFKIANDKKDYSEAFWEIRNVWISNNIVVLFVSIILLVGAIVTLTILQKKKHIFDGVKTGFAKLKEKRPVRDCLLMFGMLRHPLDTTYYMKTDKKIHYYNGLIFLVIFFLVYIFGLTCTGFIFNNVVIERTILLNEALKIIIPIVLFVVANYLASSLLDGEGTFKAIFLTTIASLMPIIVLYPIIILLSNVITNSEGFIYYFGVVVMIGWSGVILLVVNKELHNYSVKRMVLNLIMTIILMLVLLIVVILCYLMLSQVVTFIKDIISEVIFHG